MAVLVPSILENTKESFLNTYNKEISLRDVSRIQVDFGDGVFVPNKILDISEIPSLTSSIHWEAHLMVSGPQDFLEYEISGFKTIIVHYEAYKNILDLKKAITTIKSFGMLPGICLKNETPISVLSEFKDTVKHFQLMSITPGFQGTPFFENSYERIKQLRQLIPNAIIEVDGGVNITNVKNIAEAGADLIILGSAITKVENMPDAYEKLKQSLQ